MPPVSDVRSERSLNPFAAYLTTIIILTSINPHRAIAEEATHKDCHGVDSTSLFMDNSIQPFLCDSCATGRGKGYRITRYGLPIGEMQKVETCD